MGIDFAALYARYASELYQVARCMREVYHNMQPKRYGTGIGDVEGELMYMLIRDMQPEVTFEISPNAGWSTNYILAALTANGRGTLHSFELLPIIQGRPTEQVIRGNQHHRWDQQRLVIHIGDARQTVPQVDGTVDFLFIDSCHEDWFADWYVRTVFPRVNGLVIIQDIAFVDRLEPSSEAKRVWAWAGSQGLQLTLTGSVEASLEHTSVRTGCPERRGLQSNSVLFWLPLVQRGNLPELADSPESWTEQARSAFAGGDYWTADRLLNQAVASLLRMPARVNRHRLFFQAGQCYVKLGEVGESQRCFQRALGVVVQADTQQRAKGLTELLALFVRHRQWWLAAQTGAVILLEPAAWPGSARKVWDSLRALIGRAAKALWRH